MTNSKTETCLYVTVGFPASGKSMWAKYFSSEFGIKVVSSDSIREELFGSEEIQGDPKEIFEIAHNRIIEELSSGRDVIFDSTSINYKHRMQLLQKVANVATKTVAVLFATPFRTCLERNKNRSRVVPEYVMIRMRKSFTVPSYFEGWDEISVAWDFPAHHYDLTGLFDELDGFEQDNPHHTLTVGEHCKRVFSILNESANFWTCQAGLLHDIGKPETKVFTNTKGEPSEIAHYYGHECVSAYDSLFYNRSCGWNDSALLYVASLINFHMRPNGAKTEKAHEKMIKLFGENMYNDLMELHKADRSAK